MKRSIAIDINEANVEHKVGVSHYTYQILREFYKHKEIVFHLYLKKPPRIDLPIEREGWTYHVLGPSIAWTRVALPWRLRSAKHSVFWSPAHYLPRLTNFPGVVTIHDLAYEYYPDMYRKNDLQKLTKWTVQSVRNAKSIIAVSNKTKDDLFKLYGVDRNKIVVIYNGVTPFDKSSLNKSHILKQHTLIKNNYLLYVGTIQPRKNIVRLVQCFELLRRAGYPGKLVIAGKIGWLAEPIIRAIKESEERSHIVLTNYLNEEDKAALMTSASVLVQPSLYEGFGLPAIEAMSVGCPVAVANNSSLPEIVGDAGCYFDPFSITSLKSAINTLLNNRAKYSELSKKQAKLFTWEKCAKETLQVLVESSQEV